MITYKQWALIQPTSLSKCCSLDSMQRSFKEEEEEKQAYHTRLHEYTLYDALTINEYDLYYIRSIFQEQFFITSVLKNFKTECWYDWYAYKKTPEMCKSKQEISQFKKLNAKIWDAIVEEPYCNFQRI